LTRTTLAAETVAQDGAAAIHAARSKNGQLATLILPANTAWTETDPTPTTSHGAPDLHRPSTSDIETALTRLKTPGAALMIGGPRALW